MRRSTYQGIEREPRRIFEQGYRRVLARTPGAALARFGEDDSKRTIGAQSSSDILRDILFTDSLLMLRGCRPTEVPFQHSKQWRVSADVPREPPASRPPDPCMCIGPPGHCRTAPRLSALLAPRVCRSTATPSILAPGRAHCPATVLPAYCTLRQCCYWRRGGTPRTFRCCVVYMCPPPMQWRPRGRCSRDSAGRR